MTVKAIRLKNFMTFEDTGWIELRPITLLFGKNSSGKSTIIRALRLLKQSLGLCEKDAPLAFAVEDGVDVGGFQDVVYQHDLEKIITFGFRCDLASRSLSQVGQRDVGIDTLLSYINQTRIDDDLPPIPLEYAEPELDFSISFAWDLQHKPNPIVVPVALLVEVPWEILQDQRMKTVFMLERDVEEIEDVLRDEVGNIIQDKSWKWLDNWFPWSDFYHEEKENDQETEFYTISIELVNGFLPNLTSGVTDTYSRKSPTSEYFELLEILLNEFREQIITFLIQLEYVGPVRPEPARVYSLNQFEKRRWERQGWQALINFLSEYVDREQIDEIGEWLGRINEYSVVDVNCSYSGTMGLMASVHVRRTPENQADNIVDVGYGVSQVLPIIVQSVLAKPGQLVMIEQPELHLHPSAQTNLMDVFIVNALEKRILSSNNTEETQPTGVRFLLETHSEHLILRLMRRMRETFENRLPEVPPNLPEVSTDKCTIFYVEWVDEGYSEIINIALDVNGQLLDPWPGGFFEEDFEERFA